MNTYKELVVEGEQQLDTVHLFLGLQRQPDLEIQKVQLPIPVLVFLSHLRCGVPPTESNNTTSKDF